MGWTTITLAGKTVFLCCSGCTEKATADPARTAARAALTAGAKAAPPTSAAPDEEAEIRAALGKLPDGDRAQAEAQRFCPVTDERLGSMGVPLKIALDGQPVFICCQACGARLTAQPALMLAKVAGFKTGAAPKK